MPALDEEKKRADNNDLLGGQGGIRDAGMEGRERGRSREAL